MLTLSPLARAALAVALAAGIALAETKVHAGAKIEFWHPDGWKAEALGDRLILNDPSGDVWLGMWIVEERDAKGALASLKALVSKEVKDLEVGKPRETTCHGLPAILVDASGERGGAPVKVVLCILETPAKKVLLTLACVPSARWAAHEPTLRKVYDSFAPHS